MTLNCKLAAAIGRCFEDLFVSQQPCFEWRAGLLLIILNQALGHLQGFVHFSIVSNEIYRSRRRNAQLSQHRCDLAAMICGVINHVANEMRKRLPVQLPFGILERQRLC